MLRWCAARLNRQSGHGLRRALPGVGASSSWWAVAIRARHFSTTQSWRQSGSPSLAAAQDIWRCRECSELNAPDFAACVLCGSDRPNEAAAAVSAASSSRKANASRSDSGTSPTKAEHATPPVTPGANRWGIGVSRAPTQPVEAAAVTQPAKQRTEDAVATEDDVASWALPGEFIAADGVRKLRWLCHCTTVNVGTWGTPITCTKCAAPFSGVRPWLCVDCGTKNGRQRSACYGCGAKRRTAWACKQCQKPSSVFKRWCSSCMAWGAARYGLSEPLIRRTYACPSCGAVNDLEQDDPSSPPGSHIQGGNVCCFHCCATFDLKLAKRRTNELPELPSMRSPNEPADAPERLVPYPRHRGRLASVSEPLDVASPAPSRDSAASAVDDLTSEWLCGLCGTSNGCDRKACEQCFEPRRPTPQQSAAPLSSPAASPYGVPRGGGAPSGAPRLAHWKCSKCNSTQPSYAARCGSCGASDNPNLALLRGAHPDWSCPSCKFSNFGTRGFCRRCKAARPANPTAASPLGSPAHGTTTPDAVQASVSWRCPLCQFSNIRRPTSDCLVCGTDPLAIRAAKNAPKPFTLRSLTAPHSVAAALEPVDSMLGTEGEPVNSSSIETSTTWNCGVCEHTNAATAATCVLCDGPRPAPAVPVSTVRPDDNSTGSAEKYRCPFCGTKARLPPATPDGLPPLPPCLSCGRLPSDVKTAVWFCGDASCAERSALETTAPNQRDDGATLLVSMGTWNAATRMDCNRCGMKRDPAAHTLLQAASRCTACASENPMTNVVPDCTACGHGPLRRIGDYTCVICKADNFANRLYCRACHRQRNPRYIFVDLVSRRCRSSGGLPEDDAWARASVEGNYEAPKRAKLPSVPTSDYLSEEAAVPMANRRWPPSEDDAAADPSASTEEDSNNTWQCKLCSERNSTASNVCGMCGVDR